MRMMVLNCQHRAENLREAAVIEMGRWDHRPGYAARLAAVAAANHSPCRGQGESPWARCGFASGAAKTCRQGGGNCAMVIGGFFGSSGGLG